MVYYILLMEDGNGGNPIPLVDNARTAYMEGHLGSVPNWLIARVCSYSGSPPDARYRETKRIKSYHMAQLSSQLNIYNP